MTRQENYLTRQENKKVWWEQKMEQPGKVKRNSIEKGLGWSKCAQFFNVNKKRSGSKSLVKSRFTSVIVNNLKVF